MKNLTILSILVYFLSACSKTIPEKLQEFTAEDAQWFNYAVGDTFVFQNQTGDSLKIYVTKQEKRKINDIDKFTQINQLTLLSITTFENKNLKLYEDAKKFSDTSRNGSVDPFGIESAGVFTCYYNKEVSGGNEINRYLRFSFLNTSSRIHIPLAVSNHMYFKNDTTVNNINYKDVYVSRISSRRDNYKREPHIYSPTMNMTTFSDFSGNNWAIKRKIKK